VSRTRTVLHPTSTTPGGPSSLSGVHTDPDQYALAARLGERLRAAGRRLATAESCTAGWVAKAITDVPGSSQWFECGYVTYSDAAKVRDLGVAAATLAEFGAVSAETAREMALGALRVPGVSVALSVTGIAGPDGGTSARPVGTVWFCAAARGPQDLQVIAERQLFPGDRAAVRGRSVRHALEMLARLDLPADGAPQVKA
jgi:nicotinamide-nucleotide amidase